MSRSSICIVAIISILVSAFSQTPGNAPGQSSCTLNQSPAIRGIRLGMTAEEVFANFPGINEDSFNKRAVESAARPPNYGLARIGFQRSLHPSPTNERLAGVDSISITLFDDHVTDLNVSYAGPGSYPRGPSWPNIDYFIARLSEAFGLPDPKYWVDKGPLSKAINCSGFEIQATDVNGQGSVRIHNDTFMNTLKQRAIADEEKRRREFKP
jgi:hypothetical protein